MVVISYENQNDLQFNWLSLKTSLSTSKHEQNISYTIYLLHSYSLMCRKQTY